jgi:hypothetical protein
MSRRALTQEAGVLLERAATTDREAVREICTRHADLLLARIEVSNAVAVKLPTCFVDAILNAKKGDGPKVVAVAPTLTREDFIRTLPANHPARIAQEKKQQ